jgi:hypothetical protein
MRGGERKDMRDEMKEYRSSPALREEEKAG